MQRPGIEPGPPAWQARFYHWTNVARNIWVPNWRIYIKLSSCFAYELAQLVSPSRTPNNLQLSIVYKFIFTTIKFCLNPSLSIFGEKWAPPSFLKFCKRLLWKLNPLFWRGRILNHSWRTENEFTSHNLPVIHELSEIIADGNQPRIISFLRGIFRGTCFAYCDILVVYWVFSLKIMVTRKVRL